MCYNINMGEMIMKSIVEIKKLDHQGRGIGKIDGKVIFVANTCIGEEVEVEVIKNSSKYMEGRVIKILKKSSDRINFSCPYYGECGGCNIAHMNYERQLEFKKNTVKNIFKKYANIDINPNILESENELYYRNKVVFHVEKDKVGFYKEESNSLVSVDKCLLLDDLLNKTLRAISMGIDSVDLKNMTLKSNGHSTIVKFVGNSKLKNDSAMFWEDNSKLDKQATDYLKEEAIVFNLGKYKYVVNNDAFFQVNTKQAIKLYDKVRSYIKEINSDDIKVLDLYCGIGSISIYVSDLCKEVLGIEINKGAIKCANYNKKLNNVKNVKFIEGDVSNIINNQMSSDVIIVDPPRSGLDDKTISTIKEIKPKKIVYVSCNPITLARDINKLSEEYKFEDIELFDMFPQTYHVESVILLQRKD